MARLDWRISSRVRDLGLRDWMREFADGVPNLILALSGTWIWQVREKLTISARESGTVKCGISAKDSIWRRL
jgi:hypothetical protein